MQLWNNMNRKGTFSTRHFKCTPRSKDSIDGCQNHLGGKKIKDSNGKENSAFSDSGGIKSILGQETLTRSSLALFCALEGACGPPREQVAPSCIDTLEAACA